MVAGTVVAVGSAGVAVAGTCVSDGAGVADGAVVTVARTAVLVGVAGAVVGGIAVPGTQAATTSASNANPVRIDHF
jgi:hypothetical protein